jgi:hypothetical protein
LFINGYPRRRFTPAELAQAGKQAQRGAAATTDDSEEKITSEGATGATAATGAMDEEEMMNESIPERADEEELLNIGVESNGAAPISTDGLVGSDGKMLEPEGPRHRPREPLVSALQDFTTVSRGLRSLVVVVLHPCRQSFCLSARSVTFRSGPVPPSPIQVSCSSRRFSLELLLKPIRIERWLFITLVTTLDLITFTFQVPRIS